MCQSKDPIVERVQLRIIECSLNSVLACHVPLIYFVIVCASRNLLHYRWREPLLVIRTVVL